MNWTDIINRKLIALELKYEILTLKYGQNEQVFQINVSKRLQNCLRSIYEVILHTSSSESKIIESNWPKCTIRFTLAKFVCVLLLIEFDIRHIFCDQKNYCINSQNAYRNHVSNRIEHIMDSLCFFFPFRFFCRFKLRYAF